MNWNLKFFAFLLFIGIYATSTAQITIEAEDYIAIEHKGTPVVTENNGASLAFFNEAGESLTYEFNITTAGYYEIALRYTTDAEGEITIRTSNHSLASCVFESVASGWAAPLADWPTTPAATSALFYFELGQQTISLINTGTGINLDKIVLQQASTVDTSIAEIITVPQSLKVFPNSTLNMSAKALTREGRQMATTVSWSANAKNGIYLSTDTEGREQVTVTMGDTTKVLSVITKVTREREFSVHKNGWLYTHPTGGYVSNEAGDRVRLSGPSLFWSGSSERWWTKETVDWLVQDWNAQIIRAAASIHPRNDQGQPWNGNDYVQRPEYTLELVDEIVQAAIANDIYVIIDFHEHHAEEFIPEAKAFFTYFATKYKDFPNIIYEIYNEPDNGLWAGTVVNYAREVIPVIRAIDKRNIIVVGSPDYSRHPNDVADAAKDINGNYYGNIAFTFHSYAQYPHADDWNNTYNNGGLPVIATEWGTRGNNPVDDNNWVNTYSNNDVINCMWSIFNKHEDEDWQWSCLNSGVTKIANWTDAELSAPGRYQKNVMKNWVDYKPTQLVFETKIDAGARQILHLPTRETILNAVITNDDGLHTIDWSQTSGPSIAVVTDIHAASPVVSDLQTGVYTFKLSVDNGIEILEDEVAIVVLPEGYSIPEGTDIIDDVTDNDTVTLWGGKWSIFDDNGANGASVITPADQLATNQTIHANYTLDQGQWAYEPFCGVRMSLQENGDAFDLSDCETITYKYRGSAHEFRVETAIVKDDDFHKKEITATQEWEHKTINWNQLVQDTEWGLDVGVINKSDVTNFSWQVSSASGMGTIEIDSVVCVGMRGPVQNIAPVVLAGDDMLTGASTIQLDGTSSFDVNALPLTYEWSQLSGPNTASIEQPHTAETTVDGLISGIYQFVLTASNGKQSNSDTVQVDVSVTITNQTVELNQGWNLVALHITPTDNKAETIFPNAEVIKSDQNFYKASQPAYLNSLTGIKSGIGYLIYNSTAETLIISGTTLVGSQEYHLKQGWNLMGIALDSNILPSTLPVETVVVKDFDGFYYPSGSAHGLNELETGKAYFIKVSGETKVTY